MSTSLISRRQFLTLPLGLLFPTSAQALAQGQIVRGTYAADIGILYDMFNLKLHGSIEERVDRRVGEYRVLARGTGPGIANRLDSSGILHNGRWTPVRSQS